ncbi:MAG: GNAT family N-acetyltransferase [Acetobacteraceae bacterium]
MRETDAAAVAGLIRDAFAHLPVALDPPPSALGVTALAIATHLATGGGAVAQAGGMIVGTVLWEERAGGLYVSRLAVCRAARRRGVARALLMRAEREARSLGHPRLHLGTRLALAGNRRLFAAVGFVEVARHAHPGYAAPTWMEMEKSLI